MLLLLLAVSCVYWNVIVQQPLHQADDECGQPATSKQWTKDNKWRGSDSSFFPMASVYQGQRGRALLWRIIAFSQLDSNPSKLRRNRLHWNIRRCRCCWAAWQKRWGWGGKWDLLFPHLVFLTLEISGIQVLSLQVFLVYWLVGVRLD